MLPPRPLPFFRRHKLGLPLSVPRHWAEAKVNNVEPLLSCTDRATRTSTVPPGGAFAELEHEIVRPRLMQEAPVTNAIAIIRAVFESILG